MNNRHDMKNMSPTTHESSIHWTEIYHYIFTTELLSQID